MCFLVNLYELLSTGSKQEPCQISQYLINSQRTHTEVDRQINTLFILKHLRDLKVLQCFYLLVYWAASLKSNSRSPTPSCDVTEVTRKCRLKHYNNCKLALLKKVKNIKMCFIYDKQFPLWIIKKYKTPQQHKDLKKCLLTMAYIISLIHQSLVRWRNNSSFFKLFLTHSDSI